LFTTKLAFADLLAETRSRTEGPFYPTHLPLDQDNDRTIINGDIATAVGRQFHDPSDWRISVPHDQA
jgi:protocatechuate 3,4-dioxygenase beta subunit